MAENQAETQGRPAAGAGTLAAAKPGTVDKPITSTVAMVVAAAAGVALIEAGWLPGLLIGVGAMLAPKAFPNLGRSLRPVIKGAVKAGMTIAGTTKAAMAEAREEIQDIVAEVWMEQHQDAPPGEGDTQVVQ